MGTSSICTSASGILYSVREAEVGSRILLFDRDHPSVPTCTRDLPARTAAVKDGPPSGHRFSGAKLARDLLTRRIGRCRPGSAAILPFGFGQQTVVLIGHLRQPTDICLCIVPRHIDNRSPPST